MILIYSYVAVLGYMFSWRP